jgi:hypothetical protein
MSLSSSYLVSAARSSSSRGWPARSTFGALEHVADPEYLVQLYETEPYLATCVTRFLRSPLRRAGGAMVITTKEHRAAIERALDLDEINVAAAERRGQYVFLDAAETLEAVLVDGSPEPQRFRRIVGRRVGGLCGRWSHVRAVGEMVSLLWRKGNQAASHAVEGQWDALRRRHEFTLLAAYRVDRSAEDLAGAALARVCASPARLLPPQRSLGADWLRSLRPPHAAVHERPASPTGRPTGRSTRPEASRVERAGRPRRLVRPVTLEAPEAVEAARG